MTRLTTRVAQLERKRRERPPCPLCGGLPRLAVVLEDDPDPPPCPSCGRDPYTVRLVRAEDPRETA